MTLTLDTLPRLIDSTFLKPFGTARDIETLCEEACHYGFAVVAVNPAEVGRCAGLLAGSGVGISAAIGFPLGQNTVRTKLFEIREALKNGATEIDMVINVRALQSGAADIVRREIGGMVGLCSPRGIVNKVILETCYLSDAEKVEVCRIARKEGAGFVKTSTGWGSAGATAEDIALMRAAVSPTMGVKASGGIRNLDTMLAMISAGATRIGTSSGSAIMREFLKRSGQGAA